MADDYGERDGSDFQNITLGGWSAFVAWRNVDRHVFYSSQLANRRTGRVWRQLDDTYLGTVSRALGCTVAFEYCVYLLGNCGSDITHKRKMVEKGFFSVHTVSDAGIYGGGMAVRKVKGSATVETALIMPVVLLAFIVSMYMLFYLHDKNIIAGAAYEAAVVGVQKSRWEEENTKQQAEALFSERIAGKLIFFPTAAAEIKVEKESITVLASAQKHAMKVKVERRLDITTPEDVVRNIRRIHGDKI